MQTATTPVDQLTDGSVEVLPLDVPAITRRPRTAVKRWTLRTVGQPTITADVVAGLATYQAQHNGNGHNGNGHNGR